MNEDINIVLNYCYILASNMRQDAFKHWSLTLEFIKANSGKPYDEVVTKLRGVIGCDYRYLNDFIKTYKMWGVISVDNGNILYIGIPDDKNLGETYTPVELEKVVKKEPKPKRRSLQDDDYRYELRCKEADRNNETRPTKEEWLKELEDNKND